MGAITDILTRFGLDTVGEIQSNLSSTGTNASGETSQSLRSEMETDFLLRVTGRAFFNTVETGRKPGDMPPVSKIMKWLESGKVDFSGKIESVAYAISRKIGMEGSKLFRDGGRTDIITPAISDQKIEKLTTDIADASLNIVVKNIDDFIAEKQKE